MAAKMARRRNKQTSKEDALINGMCEKNKNNILEGLMLIRSEVLIN